MKKRLSFARFTQCLFALALLFGARAAVAAPESHILRIDPRAGLDNGKPILTTVIETVQANRLSQILMPCATARGGADTLSCWSDQIEKPGNLYTPVPEAAIDATHAHLFVNVGGQDTLTSFIDKTKWEKAKDQPNVGTAWLIVLDAGNTMGPRYAEARAVADAFVASMEKNDLMDLMIIDDRQTIADSKWVTFAKRNDLVAMLKAHPDPAPSHGSDRPLFTQIKNVTKDAFGSLGNWDQPSQVPLHQAMVVLSNGTSRNDPASSSPSAEVFQQYLDNGRFPENNTSLPRTPLPVISIWFPNHNMGIVGDLYKNTEAQFMQSLANPEIGGFFDVVQEGQGGGKGPKIIQLVRTRFNGMWLVHWRLACLNPTVTQSFNLVFEGTNPVIAPDATMKDVPVISDPSVWPLDVDFQKTIDSANQNPVKPGGTFTVYGNFCWGSDPNRAQAYFIPEGTKPPTTSGRDIEALKRAQQEIVKRGLLGTALNCKDCKVGDTFATLSVPDSPDVLVGSGDTTVAHVVLYDSVAKRASAVDEKTVLTLKAQKVSILDQPLLLGGIAGGALVIILLLIVVFRGGGGGKRRGAPPPQQPPPMPYGGGAPPGYGAPPPPPGGGYRMDAPSPAAPPPAPAYDAQPMFAPAAAAPAMAGGPAMGPMGGMAVPMQSPLAASAVVNSGPSAAPAVVQVRCPACNMMTMATPGQPSVCFSCGQPLPANITGGGGGGNAPAFPLTGGMPAQPEPPPNPYFQGAAAPNATGATIGGASGQFTVRPGAEVRVGRDPAQCPIYLSEPRVSGVHASLKFEGGQLWARDESSNNGTWINGARVPAGTWTPAPAGAQLRFGPIEFTVQLETS